MKIIIFIILIVVFAHLGGALDNYRKIFLSLMVGMASLYIFQVKTTALKLKGTKKHVIFGIGYFNAIGVTFFFFLIFEWVVQNITGFPQAGGGEAMMILGAVYLETVLCFQIIRFVLEKIYGRYSKKMVRLR